MGGGVSSGSNMNDVWQSSDGGATWTIVTATAGWSGKDRTTLYNLSLGVCRCMMAVHLISFTSCKMCST